MGEKKPYREIKPGKKVLKKLIVRIVFFVLGRAFQFASKIDNEIKKEISSWPDGFTIMFKVPPNGPQMVLVKESKGHVKYLRKGMDEDRAHLIIYFKNLDAAFLLLTAQIGTAKAFAENRLYVKGDIPTATSLIRALNLLETYLFPGIIAKRILKRVPRIPPLKKYLYRFLIYFCGIVLGI